MAIGPTIENLRRKRADEAALLEMLYSLPTPTGGFDVNTPAERRQLAERGLRGGEPYSDGRMDYGRQRPVQATIDVMPPQPAEFYAREVSRDILGPRATNDLFGYPQGTGTMVGDMLLGGGLLGLIGAKAPLTAWDAGMAAAQGNYGDAAMKSAFSLLEGAGLGELATGARGIKAVANEFPELAQEVGQSARRFLSDESGAVPLPFKADDPAQARGAQIIDMLTSGRAGEITDQMLDLGDPVLNANLNQYLYRNYDLPMDEASRMERAEGMSLMRNVLHGTPYSDISNLRPSDFGAVGRGVYVATNPKVASDYARGYGLMTPEKTFEYAGERFTEGGNVMPLRTTDNLQPFADWKDARMSDLKRQGLYGSSYRADDAASQAAEDAGFYGVQARQGNAVIFDPANIRSRFARFDPRLAHLRNLSAGIAPFGLLALQPNEEQY